MSVQASKHDFLKHTKKQNDQKTRHHPDANFKTMKTTRNFHVQFISDSVIDKLYLTCWISESRSIIDGDDYEVVFMFDQTAGH